MNQKKLIELEGLAIDARPFNDSDWGSDRQVEAENRFWTAVGEVMSTDEFRSLPDFIVGNKMTTEESIDYGIGKVRDVLGVLCPNCGIPMYQTDAGAFRCALAKCNRSEIEF